VAVLPNECDDRTQPSGAAVLSRLRAVCPV
jgi:hypothetical protein